MDRSKPSSKDVGRSGSQGKESARKTVRRTYKAQGLSRLIPKILKDGLGRKGSLEADLLLHWREVVGEELANWTVPSKITYGDRRMRRKGTLLLSVSPSYAQFAQMQETDIVASVNQFLGPGRIERIQIKQSPGIDGASHRTTGSSRGVKGSVSRLETRRERRHNSDLDSALETLRQSVAKRDQRR